VAVPGAQRTIVFFGKKRGEDAAEIAALKLPSRLRAPKAILDLGV
jgi:hypothetical protein